VQSAPRGNLNGDGGVCARGRTAARALAASRARTAILGGGEVLLELLLRERLDHLNFGRSVDDRLHIGLVSRVRSRFRHAAGLFAAWTVDDDVPRPLFTPARPTVTGLGPVDQKARDRAPLQPRVSPACISSPRLPILPLHTVPRGAHLALDLAA